MLTERTCAPPGSVAPREEDLDDIRPGGAGWEGLESAPARVERCATSHLGPQDVDLAPRRGRVEAVLDQPADRRQASQRPPGADHVEVDVRAVAGDDVAEVLLVSERQDGEVVHGIASTRLG